MRKKISNEALATALNEIKVIVDHTEDGKLPKEYDGYAASLGPAIITSGLLPAIAFYSDSKKEGPKKLIKIIARVCDYPEDLLTHIIEHRADKLKMARFKKKILQATVAIKLAMRNFPHTDSETQNS